MGEIKIVISFLAGLGGDIIKDFIKKLVECYRVFKEYSDEFLNDTKGEGNFHFHIRGRDVEASFKEKPNNELFSRIREILMSDSHIRQSDTSDITIEEKAKDVM